MSDPEVVQLSRNLAHAADEAATLRRELEHQGAGIGMAESPIAGIVRRRGAILLTHNRKHFERVEGLVLARPA